MDDRDRQYREYLALRQRSREEKTEMGHRSKRTDEKYGQYFAEGVNRTRPDHKSISETPYGSSDFRRKQKDKEARDEEMREYLAAREQEREERGVRSAAASGKNRGYAKNNSYKPVKEKKHKNKKAKKKPAKRKGLRRILRIFIILLVLCVAACTCIAAYALNAFGSMQHVDIDKDNLAINTSVAAQLDGYRNIAVLGIDARADEDDSQCRSDAIIVTSINEETNEVKLFSVYRDTLLNVGDEGLDKVTHAYYYGGAQQTLQTLNRNLDLNIDEVVVINWKTVADIIDSVGGIEIEIQESEIEEMNKYIPNTAKNVDGSDELIEEAGKQTLNGVQAVTYSRIRKDALTGDYRRNERMKIVFSETFKKVKEAGLFTMFKVATDAMPEIKTNMGAKEMLELGLNFRNFDMTDSTTGFPYEVGSWTGYAAAGYAWYGPPVNLANNVSKLHEQFFGQKGYAPTDTVQQISNDISYATGIY